MDVTFQLADTDYIFRIPKKLISHFEYYKLLLEETDDNGKIVVIPTPDIIISHPHNNKFGNKCTYINKPELFVRAIEFIVTYLNDNVEALEYLMNVPFLNGNCKLTEWRKHCQYEECRTKLFDTFAQFEEFQRIKPVFTYSEYINLEYLAAVAQYSGCELFLQFYLPCMCDDLDTNVYIDNLHEVMNIPIQCDESKLTLISDILVAIKNTDESEDENYGDIDL